MAHLRNTRESKANEIKRKCWDKKYLPISLFFGSKKEGFLKKEVLDGGAVGWLINVAECGWRGLVLDVHKPVSNYDENQPSWVESYSYVRL